MISADIAQGEADAGRRPSRIGVQHRDHHRHVGAADRHDDQDAEQEGQRRDRPEIDRRLVAAEHHDAGDERQREPDIEQMARRQDDRLARHAPRELEEGDDRAGEGDGADRRAERHLDQALRVDRAGHADAEGFRRVEGGRRHQHRRQADQRMERRDQLRHRRHGDAPRDHRADAAADRDAADDHRPGQRLLGRRHGQRGEHGNGHAGHAEIVAPPRGLGRRQPAQRQDEQNAGDEIEQRDEI